MKIFFNNKSIQYINTKIKIVIVYIYIFNVNVYYSSSNKGTF